MWTEDSLPPDLVRPECYERLRHPVERSDLLRLEALYRFGGVYVDMDVECLKPLEPLLEGVTLFVGRLDSGRLTHPIVGSTQGHPLVARALREVRPLEFHGYDKRATGPDFFASIVGDDPEVTILPPELLFPKTPAERRSAFTVHHEARSWKDAEGFRKDAEKAQRRLARALERIDELEQLQEEAAARTQALEAELRAAQARLRRAGLRSRLSARARALRARARLAAVRTLPALKRAVRGAARAGAVRRRA